MADTADLVKNPFVAVLLTVIVGGGGLAGLSERGETQETDEMEERFTQADAVQDSGLAALEEELDELREKYHELDKQIAIISRDLP